MTTARKRPASSRSILSRPTASRGTILAAHEGAGEAALAKVTRSRLGIAAVASTTRAGSAATAAMGPSTSTVRGRSVLAFKVDARAQNVRARQSLRWSVHADDDGEQETRVLEEYIRPRGGGGREVSVPKFRRGERVEARYRGRAKYYRGRIARERGDSLYDIDYDDGESETRVAAHLIRSLESGASGISSLD